MSRRSPGVGEAVVDPAIGVREGLPPYTKCDAPWNEISNYTLITAIAIL